MTERPYSADELMIKTYINLASDFQDSGSISSSCSYHCLKLMVGDIKSFRELPPIETGEEPSAYEFKCAYQLNSLFKRWIFENDVHTEAELRIASELKFISNQERLRTFAFPSVQDKAFWAIAGLARRYASYVLGEYSVQEHLELCRFGTRATVGVPLSKASEAQRWAVPISGSTELIEWFHFHVVSGGQSIEDYLERQRRMNDDLYVAINELAVTYVPKKFDSLRSIIANTTIGNYHSFGIGKMMEKRLKRRGYRISKLQEIHRELARQASIDGELITCDQTMASDNVIRPVCSLLLPGSWFREMDRGRIGKYNTGSTTVDISMFAGMGIGFTFPLQTLIFLSLLKAIVRYYHLGGAKVSAYGDDLIYSRSLHKYVLKHFPQFGLVINESKTFSEGRFRESCGGDYFAGVDVRPFQPKTEAAPRTELGYRALLYKTINGLARRWDVEDIPRTFNFLLSRLVVREPHGEKHLIHVVPDDYPDYSGIKESVYSRLKHSQSFNLEMSTVFEPRMDKGGQRRTFCLGLKPKTKKEYRHEPFLWQSLRSIDHTDSDRDVWDAPLRSKLSRRIERACCARLTPGPLSWKREVKRVKRGKRYKTIVTRTVPVIGTFSDDPRYVTQVSPTPKKRK